MTFGEAMADVMAKYGLTATQVSDRSGVSKPYISKLMNGKVKEPTWPKACAIIDALGLTTDEFRELVDDE